MEFTDPETTAQTETHIRPYTSQLVGYKHPSRLHTLFDKDLRQRVMEDFFTPMRMWVQFSRVEKKHYMARTEQPLDLVQQ